MFSSARQEYRWPSAINLDVALIGLDGQIARVVTEGGSAALGFVGPMTVTNNVTAAGKTTFIAK